MNYPQQGPYGHGYPQQQPYGYGPPGYGPRKSKTGLIVGLAIGGVVLVGGGVTAAILLTAESDPTDPVPVGQAYADAFNKRDVDTMASLQCKPDPTEDRQKWFNQMNQDNVRIGEVKKFNGSGDFASIEMQVTQQTSGGEYAGGPPYQKILTLKWKEDRWCHDESMNMYGLP
ncbi:hypothetical protein [Amycolatopsis sp. CA-230715]|uniref:hypothetical protein n=1 Tax=Amycolatopsis sp. CA-230715 TaxID=2745196 RepID=UPI001C012198|nr:hypothetical protein [Amycolatopsis sp. CA-230715]QWF80581.1 hypothetical protein HUW46_04004 [Amycolatopsis sp. CA-230715]